MSIINSKVLLASAILLGLGASSAQAATLSLESVRVQLPNGQVLSLNDGANWYQDSRVAPYKRYYYVPERHTYVVYNDNNPPRGWKKYKQHAFTRPAPHQQQHDNGHHNDNHGHH